MKNGKVNYKRQFTPSAARRESYSSLRNSYAVLQKNVPSYFEVPLSFSSLVDRHKGKANRYTYLHARCAPATDCPSVNSPGKIARFRFPSLNALLSHKVRFERAMAMITSRLYFSFTNSWCRMFSSLLLESFIAFTFTDMIAVFSRMFF